MTKKEKEFIRDMTRIRGMDFVRLGMLVQVHGQYGTIVGMNDSANLDVVFANKLKMGSHKHNCHPWDEVVYYDRDGIIIKDYRKKAWIADEKTD